MKKHYWLVRLFLLALLSVLAFGSAVPLGAEVVTVPRPRRRLPSVEAELPGMDTVPRVAVLPPGPGEEPDTPVVETMELKRLQLMGTIGTGDVFPRLPWELGRRPTAPEGYFFITGRIRNLGWATVHVYERRGGFFDAYADEVADDRLGSDLLDSNGNFRIGPIRRREGWLSGSMDIVLVLELDSPYAVAYSEIYGTQKPYRYEIASRRGVTPEGDRYEIGTIDLDLAPDRFYPVRVYKRVLERLRGRGVDDKVHIEFIRDVDEPVYMEEAGYVLMPYVEPQPAE